MNVKFTDVLVYDMFGTYCVDTTMNERIRELMVKSGAYDHYEINGGVNGDELPMIKFAELIVAECARIARNTNLEDVEGGDSAVLRAAGDQIEDYFGVEE